MFIDKFRVESPNVKYGEEEIESVYSYETTDLVHEVRGGSYQWVVKPKSVQYQFKTDIRVPKLGVMLVGWGGNNGSTLTAGVIANREGISWVTKDKIQQANYFGSLTQASTIRVGFFNGEEIYAPFKSLLPMVNPDDIVFGGWDVSNMNLADSMARAKVLDIDLQKQLRPYMEAMVPLPGIYDPDFIAANQGSRANNVIKGSNKDQVQQVIKDIREFKKREKVDKVVVLWTANTERYSGIRILSQRGRMGLGQSPTSCRRVDPTKSTGFAGRPRAKQPVTQFPGCAPPPASGSLPSRLVSTPSPPPRSLSLTLSPLCLLLPHGRRQAAEAKPHGGDHPADCLHSASSSPTDDGKPLKPHGGDHPATAAHRTSQAQTRMSTAPPPTAAHA